MIQHDVHPSQSYSGDCPDGNEIGALVEGRLADAARTRVAAHLDSCTACQDLVAFAIRAAGSIAPLAAAEPRSAGADPDTDGSPATGDGDRGAGARTVGARVGRYEIAGILGAGAMGVVYRATDPKLDRDVALKLVRDDAPGARERLEQEAQLAAKLAHPNVVAIYDAGGAGAGEVFVAMELVDGVTLAEWMHGEPRTVADIVGVFVQAARGLAAAHAAGLVHRDFKPSNVLVGRDGRVRVADFGLARRIAASRRPSRWSSRAAPDALATVHGSGRSAGSGAVGEGPRGVGPFAAGSGGERGANDGSGASAIGDGVDDGSGASGMGSGADARREANDDNGSSAMGSGADARRGADDGNGGSANGRGADGRRGANDDNGSSAMGSGADARRGADDGNGGSAIGSAGIVGTPAYMAPEQHGGLAADASSDQFAFCVALYEAVYGARPFRGGSLEELAAAVIAGRIAAPPATQRRRAPAWLRAAIMRGLSVARERRFVSMNALVAALEHGSAPRWPRRIAAAVALAAVLGGGGWAWRVHHRAAICDAEGAEIAALFDDDRVAAVRAAFAATGVSYAASSVERIEPVLRRYRDDLATAATAACRAAPDEPEAVVSARARCLDGKRAAFASLIDASVHADAASVQGAVETAWRSVEHAPCANTASLLASAATGGALSPEDAATLARGEGLLAVEHAPEGVAVITPLVARAASTGDRVAELAASLLLAKLDRLASDPAAAALLHRTVALAEALGLDEDATVAYALLATGADTADTTAARHRYVELARAKLERIGQRGDAMDVRLLIIESQIYQDEYRFTDAEAAVRRAIEIARREYGDDHPLVGQSIGTLSVILRFENRHADELAAAVEAEAILEHAFGEDHPTVAGAMINLAGSLVAAGKVDEGRAMLLRADVIFTRALGADHPVHGRILANLADVEKARGQFDAALDDERRALAIVERTAGPTSVEAGDVHFELAEVQAGRHDLTAARAEAEKSRSLLEAALGRTHGHVANSLLLLAEIEMDAHDAHAAIEPAERALAILTAQPGQGPSDLAEPRMDLARALWDGGGDRHRARELAQLANAATGDLGGITHDQVADWLASHPDSKK